MRGAKVIPPGLGPLRLVEKVDTQRYLGRGLDGPYTEVKGVAWFPERRAVPEDAPDRAGPGLRLIEAVQGPAEAKVIPACVFRRSSSVGGRQTPPARCQYAAFQRSSFRNWARSVFPSISRYSIPAMPANSSRWRAVTA